jgi:hypothetical protein
MASTQLDLKDHRIYRWSGERKCAAMPQNIFYLIVRSHRIGMPSVIWREIQKELLYVWFDVLVL